MGDETFEAELTRLLEEEVPKRRQAEIHKEIDALLRQLELVSREFARYSERYRDESRNHALRMHALGERLSYFRSTRRSSSSSSTLPAQSPSTHARTRASWLLPVA